MALNDDLRSLTDEQGIAARALLEVPGWLSRKPILSRIRETNALVAAYSKLWHPSSILIWIEIAQRNKAKTIKSPAGWLHSQLTGYGLKAWDPTTRGGKRWKWAAAVLEGRREDALALLERAEGMARGEARAAGRLAQICRKPVRQESLPLAADVAPAAQAGAIAPPAGTKGAEEARPQEAAVAALEETRAWMLEQLAEAGDEVFRELVRGHLADLERDLEAARGALCGSS